MTRPIHPRSFDSDGKLVRIRRTRSEIAEDAADQRRVGGRTIRHRLKQSLAFLAAIGTDARRRTGLADFPHPALGQDLTPSSTARRAHFKTCAAHMSKMPHRPYWTRFALIASVSTRAGSIGRRSDDVVSRWSI